MSKKKKPVTSSFETIFRGEIGPAWEWPYKLTKFPSPAPKLEVVKVDVKNGIVTFKEVHKK